MRFLLLLAIGAVTLHAQDPLRIDLGGGHAMEFVRIPPGSFLQGSPEGEAGRAADEAQRKVTLTKPYYIAKFPVTRGEFARFVAATGFRTEAERGPSGGFGWEGGKLVQKKEYTWRNPGFPQTDDHPVVLVDFEDAAAFCAWLSKQSGRRVALPTEAQWEYASRGGGQAGEAWHAANSPGGTQPVGKNAPNGYGLSDMLGHAWEWCEDWYAPYAPGEILDPLQTNKNLSDKPRRVLRGGAFSRPAGEARPAKRFRNDPGSRNADNGFRVVTFDLPATASVPPSVPPVNPPKPPVSTSHERNDALTPEGSTRITPLDLGPSSHQPLGDSSSSEGGSNLGFWALLLVGGAIAIFFLRKILRAGLPTSGGLPMSGSSGGTRFSSSPAPMMSGRPSGPFQIRTANDGFWVHGNVPPGTMLNILWDGIARNIAYQPGPDGQFIFTGNRPNNITVTPADIAGSQFMEDDPLRRVEPERFSPHEQQHHRGFPSAY